MIMIQTDKPKNFPFYKKKSQTNYLTFPKYCNFCWQLNIFLIAALQDFGKVHIKRFCGPLVGPGFQNERFCKILTCVPFGRVGRLAVVHWWARGGSL